MEKGDTDEVPPAAGLALDPLAELLVDEVSLTDEVSSYQPLWYRATVAQLLADVRAACVCRGIEPGLAAGHASPGTASGVAGAVNQESRVGTAAAVAQTPEAAAGQVNDGDDDHRDLLGGTPPKKRAKSAQSSTFPLEDDAPATFMSFPPSQSLEISSKIEKKHNKSNSGPSKRSKSDSNQPEGLSIEYPSHIEQPVKAKGKKKARPTKEKQGLGTKDVNVTTSTPSDAARLKGRREAEHKEKEAQFKDQRPKRAPKPNKRYIGPEWETLLPKPNTRGQVSNII